MTQEARHREQLITSFIMSLVNIVCLGLNSDELMFINAPIHLFNLMILAIIFV